MEKNMGTKNCILIVDDDYINRELLKNIFSSGYTFEEAENGEEGLEQIHKHIDKLCAIILDVQMPKMNGIDVLKKISTEGITEQVPIFLITAQDDDDIVDMAYGYGVVDVVPKPVKPIVIQKRVKTVIELFSARKTLSATINDQEEMLLENAKAIDELNRGTIEALATAIEFRDIESGQHVSRIYGMTKFILSQTDFGKGLSADTIESIARGAIMHDVGKIAISDIILNKPGRLTREEFEIMKEHTVKGAELLKQICQTQLHESYMYAADIARHHHERWDGRGYPDGLKGNEISVASQVVSIVDVYDALVSVRVYKKAFTPDEAVNMIKNGECGVFNPKLIECFMEAEPTIRKWYTGEEPDELLSSVTEDARRVNALYETATSMVSEEQENSVTDVMLLITAVQNTYDLISAVNLTKNTFHLIGMDRLGIHTHTRSGSYDDIISIACEHIAVSHRREFEELFCRKNLIKSFNEGKKSVRMEYPQIADDGTPRWMSTKVLLSEDGRTGDIIQITLMQFIDEEYAQREKTRKILSDALNLAERANNAKYDFLSKMSHDIRTPMNAIIGMTTIIAANLDNKEKIKDCLAKIGTSSKYLLGIINDVLDYSRIESGSLSMHMADFNLKDLLTEISAEYSELANGKSQHLRMMVDESVGISYVSDEYRVRQVLGNLLDNAIRYTDNGGEISVKVKAKRHAGEYDRISFVVEDNGCGIRPEFLPQIFEPFAQDAPSGSVERIGLGLSIAQNLAHLMNGDIGVVSTLGEGSAFTFEVPMERGKLTAYSENIDTDINVLVVDDDITVCEQTSVLLKNIGISAQVADNGMDAVEFVKLNAGTDKEFDVAIVDWKMPQMDGVETVRQIRKIVGKKVLVAIMSAYDWSDIEEEARAAGVDLFIAKPISEHNLRTAIACSEKIRHVQQKVTFNGEKVLIAEDNAFNAEVAKSILEMNNLTVDIASDGKAAYEMFTSAKPGEYMAIFMDIMMPVMDGHEATRAVRAADHPEAKTIPIYAMTANAFHNDILEAKLAGMNGHISKPVDFDEVTRILQSIVKNKQIAKYPTGGATFMVNCEILTKAGVNVDDLLKRLMGNESLVRIFVKKFTEDKTFGKLQAAFDEKNVEGAEMTSHTLKGMCGNLSLTELFSLFTEQVNLIRGGNFAKAEAMMPDITSLYNQTITYMEEFLSRSEG